MDFGRVVALCSFYRAARLVTTKIMGLPKAPFCKLRLITRREFQFARAQPFCNPGCAEDEVQSIWLALKS